MQSSKELVLRTIEFQYPDRIPLCLELDDQNSTNRDFGIKLKQAFEGDILQAFNLDPEFIPERTGQDEWGNLWRSLGETMGEAVENAIFNWEQFPRWKEKLPDFRAPRRYTNARRLRETQPDKFIMGGIGSLMMTLVYLRGYANYMEDIHLHRRSLEELISILYCCACDAIEEYARCGMDAVIAWEDWGLQDRLMIHPNDWRKLFKEHMRIMVRLIHDRHMKYILHSCGFIVDIIDDLIEIGVDVLQLDQQRQIGLGRLSKWRGRVCFFNPADIQFMSHNTDRQQIRSYCLDMVEALGTPAGGFMYKAYAQPRSVDIRWEGLLEECSAFHGHKLPGRESGDELFYE